MKNLLFISFFLFCIFSVKAQGLLTWSPAFPTDNSNLSFTIDCNKGNQGLLNFEGGSSNNVYVHVGVITNLSTGPSDWKYVKFTWGTADAAAKATALGNNKYQFTINNVRSFFGVPASETIKKVNIIFRNAIGAGSIKQVNSDNSDMYLPIYASNEFAVRFNLPVVEPRFIPWVEPINIAVGNILNIGGISSTNANLTLKLNGNIVNTLANATSITGSPIIGTNCDQKITLEGNNGIETKKDSFSFFIPSNTVVAALPANLQEGINYGANDTEVSLVLFAPNKNNVVVIGDFSNWAVQCSNQMNRTPDGKYYHIKLTGLTAGVIYKFQYVVDGNIKTTDPFCELILDPNNDQFINATTFPNLPAYPTGLTTGIVGTFQTAAPKYTWSASGYNRPDKKNLMIYELHLRDLFANGNWQTLTDTLSYLKKLGINAIEVMPFNEFEGNNSWGYNPDFFFAPDKAYGTKNNLKKFIDEAHKKGIAVIMDAVLNHATGLSPLAKLYWDGANNKPAANSPYFNGSATHPFSVFNDFNHASEATKYHTTRFIRHWLTEYKLDGFRWDLSKGFTQKVCADVNCWNNYDSSRVAIWQRYYDSSQVVSAGSYTILEHLGNDDEEADLANRGMLLWGKMTDQYNQNTMGYISNSSLDRAFYKNRNGWTKPHLVTYAESHDEERMMYKNLRFGNNNSATYKVTNLNTALSRMEAMQPFLLLIPGPKMIWQFGELGFDNSIFQCPNGSVPNPYGNDQCKTDPKPAAWDFLQSNQRKRLYDVIASLNKLRVLKPNAFLSDVIGGNLGGDLKKTLIINHPDLGIVAMANFDVIPQDVNVTFPTSGNWFNYLQGGTINATGNAQNILLQPGEYKVFLNQNIPDGIVGSFTPPVTTPKPITNIKDGIGVQLFPNPVKNSGLLKYVLPADGLTTISLLDVLGSKTQILLNEVTQTGQYEMQVAKTMQQLSTGIYFIKIQQNGKTHFVKFVKQ
jgi:1,4-alpha-glucan branching enzyme